MKGLKFGAGYKSLYLKIYSDKIGGIVALAYESPNFEMNSMEIDGAQKEQGLGSTTPMLSDMNIIRCALFALINYQKRRSCNIIDS